MTSITEGAGLVTPRSTGLTYTPEGYVDVLTDAEGRTVDLDYDAVGRVTRQMLPDGRVVAVGYDPEGNVTSITMQTA